MDKRDSGAVMDKARKNGKLTVLIVDDEPLSVKLLKINFRDSFTQIFEATNGRDAVDIVRKVPHIDLVLMDMKMPVMDGYSATRKIKEINPSIVVIAQTAFAMPGDEKKSIDAGCDFYFSKPINLDKLGEVIDFISYKGKVKKLPKW